MKSLEKMCMRRSLKCTRDIVEFLSEKMEKTSARVLLRTSALSLTATVATVSTECLSVLEVANGPSNIAKLAIVHFV